MDEAAIYDRLRRLENQVALLSSQAGVAWDDGSAGMPQEIVFMARNGQKMEAIKRYREMTGVGLAEAKNAVERL